MTGPIEANFDGNVFRPLTPVPLAPNTSVRLIVETIEAKPPKTSSFLQTARELKLQGPPDWSKRLNDYLYGEDIGRAV
jgi:hypothetical protein